MELFLVLTLFYLSEKNAPLRAALEQSLKFYKENRELLLALRPTAAPESVPEASPKNAPTAAETESETVKTQDELKLIEAFLKRQKI